MDTSITELKLILNKFSLVLVIYNKNNLLNNPKIGKYKYNRTYNPNTTVKWLFSQTTYKNSKRLVHLQ